MSRYIAIYGEEEKPFMLIDRQKSKKEEISPMLGRYVYDGYTVKNIGEAEYKRAIAEGDFVF